MERRDEQTQPVGPEVIQQLFAKLADLERRLKIAERKLTR